MPSTATDRLSGLSTSVAVKAPCRLKTTANHSLTGLAAVDGVTPAEGDRILVGSQTDTVEHGIYNASATAWSRAKDFDGTRDAVGGTQVLVISGTTNSNSYWRVGGEGEVVIATDEITFVPALIDDSATATFLQAGTGAVARSAQAKSRDWVSVKDFGALGDGATNDTAAILAAIAYLLINLGGTLFFPRGQYRVTSLSVVFNSWRNITFEGEGKNASLIAQLAGASGPVLTLAGDGVSFDVYSGIRNMTISGVSKAQSGVVLQNLARGFLDRVIVTNADVGLDLQSSLLIDLQDVSLLGNNIGLRTAQLASGPGCNLVCMRGGEIRGNTTRGVDIGFAAGIRFQNVDIEANGTTANAATGAIIVRSNAADESGYSFFRLDNCWFEGNLGKTIVVEASNTVLALVSGWFINNEGGLNLEVGAILSATIESCMIPNGAITLAAGASSIKNSFIHTVTDTSTARDHTNVLTSTGNLNARIANTPCAIQFNNTQVGAFGAPLSDKPTGVPVTAAGIHAALVSLGWIAA